MGMTDTVERLALIITADPDDAVRGLQKVGATSERELGRAEDKTKKWAAGFTAAGATMVGAAGAIGAALWQMGERTASLQAAQSTTDRIFKDSTAEIRSFGEQAAESYGVSERAALEYTNSLGSMLKNKGYTVQAAADLSKQMVVLGADMAAAADKSPDDAIEALGAALRGEFDPLEQFNAGLSMTAIDAEVAAMNLDTSTEAAKQHSRVQAMMAVLMRQTADIQGTAAEEMGSYTGQLNQAKAKAEEAQAALGEGFLPVMTKVMTTAADATQGFRDFDESFGGVLSSGLAWVAVASGVVGGFSLVAGQVLKVKSAYDGWIDSQLEAGKGVGEIRRSLVGGIAAAGAWAGAIAAFTSMLKDAEQQGKDFAASISEETNASRISSFQSFTDTIEAQSLGFKDLGASAKAASNDILDVDAAWAYKESLPAQREQILQTQAQREQIKALAIEYGIGLDAATAFILTAEEQGTVFASNEAAIDGYKNGVEGAADGTGALADQATRAADELGNQLKAMKALDDWMTGSVDAQLAMQDAIAGAADTVRDNTHYLFDNTEAGRENQKAYGDAVKAIKEWGQAQLEEGRMGPEEATRAMNTQIASLNLQYQQLGFNEQAIIAMNRQWFATPTDVYTLVNSNIDAETQKLIQFQRLLSDVARSWSFASSNAASAWDRALSGRRAAGGPAMSHGSYLVGERGPEIITLGDTGGSVAPTASIPPAPAGPTVVHVYIGNEAIDDRMIQVVERHERFVRG